jgi:hypothetical protein
MQGSRVLETRNPPFSPWPLMNQSSCRRTASLSNKPSDKLLKLINEPQVNSLLVVWQLGFVDFMQDCKRQPQ